MRQIPALEVSVDKNQKGLAKACYDFFGDAIHNQHMEDFINEVESDCNIGKLEEILSNRIKEDKNRDEIRKLFEHNNIGQKFSELLNSNNPFSDIQLPENLIQEEEKADQYLEQKLGKKLSHDSPLKIPYIMAKAIVMLKMNTEKDVVSTMIDNELKQTKQAYIQQTEKDINRNGMIVETINSNGEKSQQFIDSTEALNNLTNMTSEQKDFINMINNQSFHQAALHHITHSFNQEVALGQLISSDKIRIDHSSSTPSITYERYIEYKEADPGKGSPRLAVKYSCDISKMQGGEITACCGKMPDNQRITVSFLDQEYALSDKEKIENNLQTFEEKQISSTEVLYHEKECLKLEAAKTLESHNIEAQQLQEKMLEIQLTKLKTFYQNFFASREDGPLSNTELKTLSQGITYYLAPIFCENEMDLKTLEKASLQIARKTVTGMNCKISPWENVKKALTSIVHKLSRDKGNRLMRGEKQSVIQRIIEEHNNPKGLQQKVVGR